MKLRAILIMAAAVIALGAVLFVTTRPKPPVTEKPRPFVWSVEMDQLKTMAISLPHAGKKEAWVKHADEYWYFDAPNGPKVNMKRWGGGVPLLLSGPGANRLIAENGTDDQLKIYGLADPQMRIRLALEDGAVINIDVGDSTPDRQAYYIRLADSRAIYTVDYTWYGVLERLVLDPPYPAGESIAAGLPREAPSPGRHPFGSHPRIFKSCRWTQASVSES